jgi:hypothetical protein
VVETRQRIAHTRRELARHVLRERPPDGDGGARPCFAQDAGPA